jgi:hypothetical protein
VGKRFGIAALVCACVFGIIYWKISSPAVIAGFLIKADDTAKTFTLRGGMKYRVQVSAKRSLQVHVNEGQILSLSDDLSNVCIDKDESLVPYFYPKLYIVPCGDATITVSAIAVK